MASLFWICQVFPVVVAQEETSCLANPTFNKVFQDMNGRSSIPTAGSCCQKDVCNIPCPAATPKPGMGYGAAVAFMIIISFAFGLYFYMWVDDTETYFVARNSIPTWVICISLGGQALDSNSLLGNVDLAYRFSFWDGAGTLTGAV
jgi:hypothetical protein